MCDLVVVYEGRFFVEGRDHDVGRDDVMRHLLTAWTLAALRRRTILLDAREAEDMRAVRYRGKSRKWDRWNGIDCTSRIFRKRSNQKSLIT